MYTVKISCSVFGNQERLINHFKPKQNLVTFDVPPWIFAYCAQSMDEISSFC